MTDQEVRAVVLETHPLREAGRHGEALALIEAALARDPEAPLLLSTKGAILHELGRNNEAAALHEAAIACLLRFAEQEGGLGRSAARQTSLIWRQRGDTLYALKRYQEALASYEEARRLVPNHSTYWQNCGSTLLRLRRYPEAVEAYQRENELQPDNLDTLMDLSTALRSAKRYPEALATADQALAHASGDEQMARALWRRAHVLWYLRRRDEALADIEQACTLEPNVLTYWEFKTDFLLRMGRWRAGWQSLQHTQSLSDRWHRQQRANRARR